MYILDLIIAIQFHPLCDIIYFYMYLQSGDTLLHSAARGCNLPFVKRILLEPGKYDKLMNHQNKVSSSHIIVLDTQLLMKCDHTFS